MSDMSQVDPGERNPRTDPTLPLPERPYVILVVRTKKSFAEPAGMETLLRDFNCTHGLTDGTNANKQRLTSITTTLQRKLQGEREMDMTRNKLTPRQRLMGGIAMFPEGSHVLVVANEKFIDEALQGIFDDSKLPEMPRVTDFHEATIFFAMEVFSGHPKERNFKCSLQVEDLARGATSC